ncbi:MAG: thiamine pyrophosphate-dependent enzyme [Desulfitobacteriaceae bacterium]|nr:thiamine pyrophosphate-dependent enzyme [Desulfitobacteriaceae bacterium]MDD4753325.1 thiamine pyrophosphate-dependent enzyme [Desulfitobacteriaceae bacterium]
MCAVYHKYLRLDHLPHIWCPGCGNGIVMGAFIRAMEDLKYDQNEVVVVSGIGCSGRISGYLDFNTLHTTHGRALAFATGIKAAEPRLKIFVFMGDGDATAIGGNHLIHACRRNIDMTAIIINNCTFGMTGGQFSPMTPKGKKASTAPYGTVERNFDIPALAQAAGATLVARVGIYQVNLLRELIVKASHHKGFALLEVISQCPVNYGRRNQMGDPAEMLEDQKGIIKSAGLGQGLENYFGQIFQSEQPEFIEEYNKMIVQAQKKGGCDV